MFDVRFSFHASERIAVRLHGLVKHSEIKDAIYQHKRELTQDKNFVLVKRIPFTKIYDPDVKPDGLAKGDSIVAIVTSDGYVKSVTLRKSSSKSDEFCLIIQ